VLLYFSSALRLAVIGRQRFKVSDFQPVTYWQTASNCLQSRQGSKTIQLVSTDFEREVLGIWRGHMGLFGLE